MSRMRAQCIKRRSRVAFFARLTAFVLIAAVPSGAQQVSFRKAIETALKRSGALVAATVDRDKAADLHKELRSAYLPNVLFGSGLGYTFGVPLTIGGFAPSLFNLTSQQFLLNFAQRNYIRAARADLSAAQIDYVDRANQVVLDTALLYIELDSLTERLRTLNEEKQLAERASYITSQRADFGLDSALENKRAQLTAARVAARIAEAENAAELLRERLGRLLGVPPESLQTDHASVPATPDVSQDRDAAALALENSSAVKMANERVKAAEFRARAERDQLLPAIDLASQYQVLTKFNNYEQYYKTFSRNNISVGAVIRVPIFNFAQRTHARAAEVEVVRARNDAGAVRAQVSDDALRSQRSLRQFYALLQVAKLDYEVAQANVDAVQSRLTTGQANSRDLENARIDVSDKYVTYLQAQYDIQRATLQLLRQTGEIQPWALPANRP
ncbi:MAG TPA: TolC family protein [Candidatus Acidoferrales bacterium]|nr:TolC family protein [Candidatus Acidoferrales bacterium]